MTPSIIMLPGIAPITGARIETGIEAAGGFSTLDRPHHGGAD